MRKRYIVLLIALQCAMNVCSAQATEIADIKVGEMQEIRTLMEYPVDGSIFLGRANGYYYGNFRLDRFYSDIRFCAFDENFNLIDTIKLIPEKEVIGVFQEGLYVWNNHIYFFDSKREGTKRNLYYSEIVLEGNELKKSLPVKLLSIPETGNLTNSGVTFSIGLEALENTVAAKSNFHFCFSPDSTFLSILYMPFFEGAKTDRVNIALFDTSFNQIFYTEIEFEKVINVPIHSFKIREMILDDAGIFNALFSFYPPDKKGLDADYSQVFNSLLTVNSTTKSESFSDISITGYNLYHFRLLINENNIKFIGGSLQNKEAMGGTTGLFWIPLESKSSVLGEPHVYEFTEEFIKSLPLSARYDYAKDKTLEYCPIINILSLSDNSYFVLAEVRELYYYDAVVLCVNKENELVRFLNFPKDQRMFKLESMCSYYTAVVNDQLYLFYNDNPANNNIGPMDESSPWTSAESSLIAIAVSPDGKWKKTTLSALDKKQGTFQPLLIYRSTETQFICSHRTLENLGLTKISFK